MKNLSRKKWLLILFSFMLIIGMAIGFAAPTMAATTATVTVTNTTQYISVTVSPTTYNFNATGAAHAGVLINTTYYSNPIGQTTSPSATVASGGTECAFDITSGASVGIDLTLNSSDMSGGADNSTNGNTGTAGATSYGAYTYWAGALLSAKVLMKSSASGVAYSNLAAAASQYFGIWLNEQTNAWTGATAATFTVTITAAAH